MAETQRTTLNKTWLVKFGIFALVCLVLGSWFLYDALVIYPERGRADAEFQLKEYLTRVSDRGELGNDLKIADPDARLSELQARREDLVKASNEASGLSQQNSGEAAKLRTLMPRLAEKEELDWLESLKTVGDLTVEKTAITNWRESFKQLKDKWAAKDAPKPLSGFDIPVQWGLMVVCYAVLAWLAYYIVRSMMTVYTWDPASRTLTLPGGRTVTPANLADIDKRRWDRFYATITTNDGEPPAKMDLLRFVNLEGWVLELEKVKFPDRAAASSSEAAAQGGTNADGPTSPPTSPPASA